MSQSEEVKSIYSHMRDIAGVYSPSDNLIHSAFAGGIIQDFLKNSIAGSVLMDDTVRFYQEEVKRHNEMMSIGSNIAGGIPINALQQIGSNLSSLMCVGGNAGVSQQMMQEEISRQMEVLKSMLPFTVNPEDYSFNTPIVSIHKSNELDTLKSKISKKDKEIKELRKDNESLTRELEHEQIQSDKSRRVIEWLTDQRGSFYKSDVEEDD